MGRGNKTVNGIFKIQLYYMGVFTPHVTDMYESVHMCIHVCVHAPAKFTWNIGKRLGEKMYSGK